MLNLDAIAQKHQVRIAKQTLRYSDIGATIMGGMSKHTARQVLSIIAGWSDQRIVKFEVGQ
jgi:hypothetical protein